MTKQHRAQVANWVMLGIAFIAITIGYIRLDETQSDLRAESVARSEDVCASLQESQKPLRDIIKFVTKPADLTGLTGDRLSVGQATNAAKVKAREDLLPLIPQIKCKSG